MRDFLYLDDSDELRSPRTVAIQRKHVITQLRARNAMSMPCRMEPEVNELILESLNINYIDESEYPSTTDIQNRCSTPFTSVIDMCDSHPEQVVANFQANAYIQLSHTMRTDHFWPLPCAQLIDQAS